MRLQTQKKPRQNANQATEIGEIETACATFSMLTLTQEQKKKAGSLADSHFVVVTLNNKCATWNAMPLTSLPRRFPPSQLDLITSHDSERKCLADSKQSTLVLFFFLFRWQPLDCMYFQSGLFPFFSASFFCFLISGENGLELASRTKHQTFGGQWMNTKLNINTIRLKDGKSGERKPFNFGHLMPLIPLCIYSVLLCNSSAGKRCAIFVSCPLMVSRLLLARWLTAGVWTDLAGKSAVNLWDS